MPTGLCKWLIHTHLNCRRNVEIHSVRNEGCSTTFGQRSLISGMTFEPERPEPEGPGAPTVDTVLADMGEVRRHFWLTAALRHIGEGGDSRDAEDVLQSFITNSIPAVCRNYVPAK